MRVLSVMKFPETVFRGGFPAGLMPVVAALCSMQEGLTCGESLFLFDAPKASEKGALTASGQSTTISSRKSQPPGVPFERATQRR